MLIAVTVSGWGTLHLTSTPYYVDPTLLPGDVNLDGTVDVQDLAILAANYRKNVTGGWMQGDFNNDGVVDVQDLALLAANYRRTQASESSWTTLDSTRSDPGVVAGRNDRGSGAGSPCSLRPPVLALLAHVWRKWKSVAKQILVARPGAV